MVYTCTTIYYLWVIWVLSKISNSIETTEQVTDKLKWTIAGTHTSKRAIANKAIETNKKVKVNGKNNTTTMVNKLYIGLTKRMNNVIGNTSTNNDKKEKW